MIKVMGSFFRKLIFVANTCAIITQIDIHLFIHSFIHSFIHRRRRRQIFYS